jgi:hypothetical protein
MSKTVQELAEESVVRFHFGAIDTADWKEIWIMGYNEASQNAFNKILQLQDRIEELTMELMECD